MVVNSFGWASPYDLGRHVVASEERYRTSSLSLPSDGEVVIEPLPVPLHGPCRSPWSV